MKSTAHTDQIKSPSKNVGSKSSSFFKSVKSDGQTFFGTAVIQPKLEIGEPDDPYEKQADRVADAVVRMPDASQPVQRQETEEEEELQMKRETTLQRKCKECEEEENLQRKSNISAESGNTVSEPISTQLRANSGKGNQLPLSVQSEMRQKIGADFSGVSIHTGSDASQMSRSIGARAFTHGEDIYFNSGEYNPSTQEGKHLLAHELTHVVQQGGSSGQIQRQDDNETIEVDIIEVPEHPGNVEQIALDSLRTIRAILGNLNTALNNFETAIANESQEEARPKDAMVMVMEEVAKFTLQQVMSQAASLVPGGSFAVNLTNLVADIGKKINEEQQRSSNAMARNEAANFIINIRNDIAESRTNLETSMTEEAIAVSERYNNASPESQQQIRFDLRLKNDQLTQLAHGAYSAEQLFIRITEVWIRNTTAPGREHESRVYVKLDDNWDIIQVYIQAPFGSRLGEQIQNIDPMQIQDFNVPRVIIWYPLWNQGDRITNVAGDIPPEGGTLENLRANITGQNHIEDFLHLLRTEPIPHVGSISGSTTQ
jgi:hypothetical protein